MAVYTVVSGDTLSAIADDLGVTLDELLDANPDITNPNLINVGQEITIPGTEDDDGGGGDGDGGGRRRRGQRGIIGGDIGDDPIEFRPGRGEELTTIPAGAQLLRVRQPEGSDDPVLFYLTYQVNGVTIAYEVGNARQFQRTFGENGINLFDEFSTVNADRFEDLHIIPVGLVDEILDADESLESQIQRDIQAVRAEGIPAWWDDEVTYLHALAIREGWSPNREAQEIARTEAFQNRFGNVFGTVADQLGSNNPIEVTDEIIRREGELRNVIRSVRGADANARIGYLQRLIATGWQAPEVEQVLRAARQARQTPGMLQEANAILRANGLETLTNEDGLIDLLTGNATDEVYQAFNEALQFSALRDAGIDVTAEFISELDVLPDQGIGELGSFTEAARQTALELSRSQTIFNQGLFGLTQNDLIAVLAGGAVNPETGRTAADIEDDLARVRRMMAERAQGLGGPQAFITGDGRLQIQGLSAL